MTQAGTQILEYERKDGRSPFNKWFGTLNLYAQTKVRIAISRMGEGNFSGTKSLKQGLFERRLDFGPGYRIYFGKDRGRLIILLGGGTKRSQQRDVETARNLWVEYKSRKKEGDIRWH